LSEQAGAAISQPGITDNLANKARKLGIRLFDFRKRRFCSGGSPAGASLCPRDHAAALSGLRKSHARGTQGGRNQGRDLQASAAAAQTRRTLSMTKLTTYSVSFRTEQDLAFEEIDAPSPEAALAEARAIADDRDRLANLHLEPYAGFGTVDEITVESPEGETVGEWLSPDFLQRVAAGDLFTALEKALVALNTAPRFKVPKLSSDSYAIAAECGRAIAKARGENDPNAA
jgi:hypothetical protein